MSDKTLCVVSILVCGAATVVLMTGEGGMNPRNVACGWTIVLGFAAFIFFYIRSSRKYYGVLAREAGLSHVRDFTGDVAFQGEAAGRELRIEFFPINRDRHRRIEPNEMLWGARARIRLMGLEGVVLYVGWGGNVLTRDLRSMLEGLPKIEAPGDWAGEKNAYGRPEDRIRSVFSRVTPLKVEAGQRSDWRTLSVRDGGLEIEWHWERLDLESLSGMRDVSRRLARELQGA